MRLWPRKLRARLTLGYTLVFAAMLAVFTGVTFLLLERTMRENFDASLASVARVVAETSRQGGPPGTSVEDALESMLGPSLAERFFRLLDPFGNPDPRMPPRARTPLPLSPDALRNAARGLDTYETVTLPAVSPYPVRVLTEPVVERGRVTHLVQVAMPLEIVERARSRFLWILIGLAPAALAAAAAGGWFLARRALAPVDAMVDAASRIRAEDLSRRLEGADADDELGRLARVLNEMLVRLERSFTTMRQFSADAAHELRTPLTILRGELDTALQATASRRDTATEHAVASCLEEVDRMSRLVDDLLLLERTDAGAEATRDRVELPVVVAEIRPALEALAEVSGVELRFAAEAGGVELRAQAGNLVVSGNARLLARMLFNLVENAIKYTPPGGRVEVDLAPGDRAATIAVADTGSGITPQDLEHVFDRFYRADAARTRGGSGLGLAIAQSIARLHGGRIVAESTPGRGSRFSAVLPLPSPSAARTSTSPAAEAAPLSVRATPSMRNL